MQKGGHANRCKRFPGRIQIRATPRQVLRKQQVVEYRQRGDEMQPLRHETDRAAAPAIERGAVQIGEIPARDYDRARRRPQQSA